MSTYAVQYSYAAPEEQLATIRPEHRAFLGQLGADGVLLASGPMVDYPGALLIFKAESPEALAALLDQDPFALDLARYWEHWAYHRVAVLWAAHAIHHQSEDYNLSTALRQTSSGSLLGWVFYVPMALAGVPPLVFAVVALVDLLE